MVYQCFHVINQDIFSEHAKIVVDNIFKYLNYLLI